MAETVAWVGKSIISFLSRRADRTLGKIFKHFRQELISENPTSYLEAEKLVYAKGAADDSFDFGCLRDCPLLCPASPDGPRHLLPYSQRSKV